MEPKTTKENIKTITRWLAQHYDKSAEDAMFALEKEIDHLTAQIHRERGQTHYAKVRRRWTAWEA